MPPPSDAPDPRLDELFERAASLDPVERADFLRRACAGSPTLRRQLEELLAVDFEAEQYFDEMTDAIAARGTLELAQASSPKIQVGPYKTVGVLGTGGMGVVYRARRVDGEFQKEVALKLLHLDMLADSSRQRFLAERQILAQLEHPGIARLLDGGVTGEGRPYFVMELVEGLPIDEHCRERRLSLETTLGLFGEAVQAVGYLHGSLVVHRDLKPSNIFVDTEGRVKLLDFGIAKLIGGEASGATITGQRLLTPRYAAPEQFAGGRVTTATDVYGLGVVLYELLTGRLPHARESLDPDALRHESIRAPSAALRAVPTGGASSWPPWRRIAPDLERICLKALAPEPERRYASAEQLGQDLDRFLAGRPVSARPATVRYRATKFVRRHRAGVVLAAAALLVLAAGFARERALRHRAQVAAGKAEAVSSVLGSLIASADPANSRGREITVSEVLDHASETLAGDDGLSGQPGVEAEVRLVLGRTYLSLGRREEAQRELERAIALDGAADGTLETAGEVGLQAIEELGVLIRRTDPERSGTLLRRLLAVRRARHGPGHERTLSAMASLSRALGASQMAEAEALDREVLAGRRTRLGRRHPDTIRAMNTLAGTLFMTQRYGPAAELYREGFELAREVLGEDHPDTLRLAGNLATTLSALGRFAEAEAMHRQILASRIRLLGESHADVGGSLHNLAIVLMRQARYAEAEQTLRRGAPLRSDAGRLYSQSYLADAIRDQGRLEEAEEVYLETLTEQRALFEPDFPDTYRTLLGLGELRLAQRRPEEAAELATRALAGFAAIYGDEHRSIGAASLLLARAERERGRLAEAASRIDRAVAIAEATLPEADPEILDAKLERARIRLAAGDPQAALEGLPELVDRRLERLGLRHPASHAALEVAAAASEAAGLEEQAEAYRSRLR